MKRLRWYPFIFEPQRIGWFRVLVWPLRICIAHWNGMSWYEMNGWGLPLKGVIAFGLCTPEQGIT